MFKFFRVISFKKILLICLIFILIVIIATISCNTNIINRLTKTNSVNSIINSNIVGAEYLNQMSNISTEELVEDLEKEKSYIKWVDFKGTAVVLKKLADTDINSHVNNEQIQFNWIELMAYLGCKYGGELSLFKDKDLENLLSSLREGYDAIFHEYIGEYEIATVDEQGNKKYVKKYGLKAFSPIAKNYYFSHYKDFGSARSYGYRRVHLGNDLLRKYWHTNYRCRIWLY